MPLPPGLYEAILTRALERSLPDDAQVRELGASEASRRLGQHLGELLERALATVPAAERPHAQVTLVNELLEVVGRHCRAFPLEDDAVEPKVLRLVGPERPRPQLPLSESGLYVNANRERSLDQALRREAASADRIDLICAFLFWQGYRHLKGVLRRHLEAGGQLRVLTTTYSGVTQARVLDELQAMGAQVRVSYESGGTRLHAKSWLFHRDSGFGTAFVGSSNLSHTALTSGREWNVRLSQIENRAVFSELRAAFENHWQDEEFLDYDGEFFRKTMRAERPVGELRSVFTLRPRTFQKIILERLDAEREVHGHHRNLVVAATGTGKTVVAALDYARLCAKSGKRLPLLFVAHRKEILTQARDTFRHAVSDGSFGELFVAGERPLDWDHVFASVQSLANQDLSELDPSHFAVVIVDEFHHAAAPTYRRLLEHVRPQELLALTATPERSDGQSVLEFFDGRISSELRLWDAIDRGLLVPFQYWGLHDGMDLRLAWRGGGYDPGALDGLYTGHHARAHLVVEALREYVADPTQMRALAFCAGVNHAAFMHDALTQAGLSCALVLGSSSKLERREAIKGLRDGSIQVLLTVDVFNEGVDIPEIDTVLFLRPTESATIFLQQLGRGLRLYEGKRALTVLDFVGLAHGSFSYAERFRALVGRVGRKALTQQVREDFPFLPSGCSIQLDRVAKDVVLDNIAAGLKLNKRSLAKELRESGAQDLTQFLERSGLELEELYRGGRCFCDIARLTDLPCPPAGPLESRLARGLARLIHVDDQARIQAWQAMLAGDAVRAELRWMLWSTLLGRESVLDEAAAERSLQDHPGIRWELEQLLTVLAAQIQHRSFDASLDAPLRLHARYRLNEIMAAFGDVRDSGLYLPREGVHFDQKSRCNLLFVTLSKAEEDYSPTTLYADYALGPRHFHWQSQSGTRAADKKGQRHLRHVELGVTPLLFVRPARKDDRGETCPYTFLGPVRLQSWHGERPMNIEWELAREMPAALLREARVVG